MIEIGKYNTLTILRDTKVGLFLGNPQEDPEGIHDILLPNKYVPNEFEIGEELIVFVYLDHEQRPVSTTLEPYILLNEFSLLRVNYINQVGAFMDWGMEKDILVPFKEQARPMEKGKRYLVYLYMDEKTNPLCCSLIITLIPNSVICETIKSTSSPFVLRSYFVSEKQARFKT